MKWLVLLVLFLAGCASSPKVEAPVVSPEMVVAATRQAMVQACSSGYATAKTDVQFAMVALGQSNCMLALVVGGSPQGAPVRQELGGWGLALAVGDRLIGFGLQALGLKYSRDGVVTQSNNNREIAVASYGALQQVAASGFASNQGIATSGFNAMTALTGNVTGWLSGMKPGDTYTISGTGIIGDGNSMTWDSRRNCTGGAGAGTTTGAPGGPATC